MAPHAPKALLCATCLALLSLGVTPAHAEDSGSQDCVECGHRRPGFRPRELAILESVVEAVRQPAKAKTALVTAPSAAAEKLPPSAATPAEPEKDEAP